MDIRIKPRARADVRIFSKNLRHLMNGRNIGARQLALELYIAPPRVKAWLEGRCFPKESALIMLCEYFEFYDIFKLFTESIKS